MDESSRLIAELQQNLHDLDHKVAAYRHDMASEYYKYAEDLLNGVPVDVSVRVKNAIAETMTNYPSLSPALLLGDSTAPAHHAVTLPVSLDLGRTAKASLAIPSLPLPGDGSLSDGQRSPHAREAEFNGLFTPSYLPLLDSTDRKEKPSSADVTPSIDPSASAPISFQLPSSRTNPVSTMSSSYEPASPLPKPPTPKRRNTDEVSIRSDGSENTKRRSALRRTSSSSKAQSPRRVRFEFEGTEFSTTSSPKIPAPIEQMTDPGTDHEPSLLDSDDEAGSEMVENIDDPAPPKRISSSQLLRNLSRGPMEDDGTKWTEVVAPSDGSASVEGTTNDSDSDDDGFMEMSRRKKSSTTNANEHGKHAKAKVALETTSNGTKEEDLIAAEEADVLPDLAPLVPMKSNKVGSTAAPSPENVSAPNKPVLQPGSLPEVKRLSIGSFPATENGKRVDVTHHSDDEEELFGFEESPSRSRTKYIDQDSSDEETMSTEAQIPSLTNATADSLSAKPIYAQRATAADPMGSLPGSSTIKTAGRMLTQLLAPQIHPKALQS